MNTTRIYIVEDEALIVMEIADRLTHLGYQVCGKAARGEQALEEIPRVNPDIVLMDICLAGKLNGIDTAARLRQRLNLPVVFLSAFSDTRLIEEALGSGAFGYLIKPFDERELHATLQAALYKHRLECALQKSNVGLEETIRQRTGELMQSEAQLRDLFDGTSDLIQSVALDGRLLFVNRAWRETLGYSADEVATLNIFDVIQAECRDHCRSFMQRIIAGEDAGLVEISFQAKDGRVVVAEGQVSLRIEGGRPVATRGIFRDITERKAAEGKILALNKNLEHLVAERTGELRESEERYRYLMSTVPGAVYEFCVDVAGRRSMPFISERIVDLIGLSAADIMADVEVAFRRIPTDAMPAMEQSIRQSIEQLSPWLHEFPILAATGEEKWLRGHSVPSRHEDGAIYWTGVLLDVTAQRQAEEALRKSEEQFRAAYHNASVGISICDLAGRLQEVNHALCEILGYSRQELLTTDFQSLTHPDDLPDNLDKIRHLLAGTAAHHVFEKRYIRKNGETVWAHVGLSAIRNLDGAPSHLMAMVQDITERKRIEESLRESEERYRLLTDATFDGIAIHDQGIMIEVNPGLERMFGYGPGELTGKHILTVVADESRDMVIANMKKGEPGPYESVGLRKDGSTFYGEVVIKPYRYNGREVRLVAGRDITERKRFEDRLRRTQYAIDHATDSIFVIGSDGYFLDVNESACRHLGYTKQDLLTKSVMDIDPDCPPAVWRTFWDEFKRLKQMRIETRHRSKSGEIYPVEVVANYIEHNGKELDYAFVRDITERKQTESALQFLSSGIAHLRGEAFFSEMAVQVAKLLGQEIGFVGKLLAQQPPRMRAIGLAMDGQTLPPVEYDLAGTPCERVIGKRTAIFPENIQQLFPEDRMLVDLGISSYAAIPLFDTSGRPIGHVGVMSRRPLRQAKQAEDLLRLFAVPAAAELERQRTETKFHDLFEFSPDAVLMVNQEGLITLANRQAQSLFGYSQEELLGLPVEKLMPESERQEHVHLRQRFLSDAMPRIMGTGRSELHALKKDGTRFPIDISLSPIQSEEGLLVAAAVRDITERKQAEAALQAFQDQIRQMQKMEAIGQLAGGIAHDFNNILTAILGNADIVCAKIAADHPAQPNLTRIVEAGTRASHLVQQILTFTHQQKFSRTALDLAPVLHEALALLRATLPAGIKLTTACDTATPPVLADATQIHQIVMNLCTNAWHALQEQPGQIAVDLAPVTLAQPLHSFQTSLPPGLYARLSIRDTGCGMEPETVERIFDPFFTTKPIGQGTGLGLSVVHGIVKGHEGAIVVDSNPGQGTTFHLYFPAVETAAQVRESVRTANSQPQGRNRHLLYLDDEEMLVELIRAKFESLGYQVTGYTKPTEAIDAVRANPSGFDVVVTDYNMPGLSGLEVATTLSQIRADLPVVVASGYLSPTAQAAMLTAGIKDIIYKPALLQQLGEVVARLTDATPPR